MKLVAAALAAGGLALAAGTASATTSTLDWQGYAHGSNVFNWDTGTDSGGTRAGAFTMLNEETNESFIAWCIDLLTELDDGDVEYNLATPVLTATALGRVQTLFDANYEYSPLSGVNSAAFQAAIWDAIYDDDWNAGTFGTGGTTGFRISGNSSVLAAANGFLSAASTFSGSQEWILTQHQAVPDDASQDLITVQAIPGPFGVLLLGSAFVAAGAVRRGAKRRTV